jgi:tryptophan synthase alpha chain
VVGSALIDALKNTLDAEDRATAGSVAAVTKLVKELSDGVRSVAKRAAA